MKIEVEVSSLAWAVQMLENNRKVKQVGWSEKFWIYLDHEDCIRNENGREYSILGMDFQNKWELAE